MKLLIISGLSGSGKSIVLHALEDMGYYCIDNLPLSLIPEYMALLKNAYQPQNLESVMCRTLISVDWRGYVYDCDFNQMLGVPLGAVQQPRIHIKKLSEVNLTGKPITVKDHCYGCTAGQGSSCGGALI